MAKYHTKEELERDPLAEFIGKVSVFYSQNKTILLSAVVTLAVVVAVLVGYNVYSSKQEAKAQILLAQAENFYSEGDYYTALNGDEVTFTPGFLEIALNYSGTNAGNLAIYYASVSSFKLGNYEDALAYINKYKHVKGILGVSSLSFEASLHELNKEYEKAAEIYTKAAEWDKNDSTTPYNLYKAANAYYHADDYTNASLTIERIISEYPESDEFAGSQRLQGILLASGN